MGQMSEKKLKCVQLCETSNIPCKCKNCRYFINFEKDLNCTFVVVEKNGPMTLVEISKRLGYTPARISQIEKKALDKVKSFPILND